jgi:hypothetical protein
MKKEKYYQIITVLNKKTVVYYDENNIEEFRENYVSGYVIKEGYISFHLTLEVPEIYNTVSEEIKNLYLNVILDGENINEDNTLTVTGSETLKHKIRVLYSEKISNIFNLRESVERYVLGGELIPQTIMDQRETLKTEYHNLITYLGL